jgi:hypothetical protein
VSVDGGQDQLSIKMSSRCLVFVGFVIRTQGSGLDRLASSTRLFLTLLFDSFMGGMMKNLNKKRFALGNWVNRLKVKLFFSSMALTTLSACTIHPGLSAPGHAAPLPSIPNSSITMPVVINVATLADKIDTLVSAERPDNHNLPNTHFSLSNPSDNPFNTLQVSIYRSGHSTFNTTNGCLDVGVPLKIEDRTDSDPFTRVDVDYDTHFLGKHVRVHGNGHGAANISGHGCFSVAPDWHLHADVAPALAWTQSPTVTVNTHIIGTLTFDIADKLKPFINNDLLPGLRTKLADYVSQLPLRTTMERAWTASQRPIQLSQNPPLTLVIEPISVGVNRLTSSGNELIAEPTIVAKVNINAGSLSTPPATTTPLSPNTGTLGPAGFNLSVRVDVTYVELSILANELLAGKTFPLDNDAQGKRTITLDAIKVSGFGDKVLMRADFRAKLHWFPFNSASGWLYLIGTPHYNETTRFLTFTIDKIDSNTDSLLVDAAAQLKVVRELLEKEMKLNLAGKVDPVRNRIEAGTHNLPIAPGVAFNAMVTSFDLSDIYVGPDSIGMLSTARGSANLAVSP